jgi:hypothetical protein
VAESRVNFSASAALKKYPAAKGIPTLMSVDQFKLAFSWIYAQTGGDYLVLIGLGGGAVVHVLAIDLGLALTTRKAQPQRWRDQEYCITPSSILPKRKETMSSA